MKRENAILTYTNTLFYPLCPREEEVKIEDIAHALSQMCRANGHFKRFYSVAQHSLNCAGEARARGLGDRMQLACLLHDASEAYISDITRPVKYYLEEYRKIEHNLQTVIYTSFGLKNLSAQELVEIEAVDNALLYFEFEQLHHQGIHANPPRVYSVPEVRPIAMTEVEQTFISLTKLLTSKQKGI